MARQGGGPHKVGVNKHRGPARRSHGARLYRPPMARGANIKEASVGPSGITMPRLMPPLMSLGGVGLPSMGSVSLKGIPGLSAPLQLRMYMGMVLFDKSIIRTNWNALNRGPLAHAGNLVRRRARQSIRYRRNRGIHSAPGTPPHSHQQGPGAPFKMIFSVPDPLRARQYVGMVGFGGAGPPVPGLHEHGGTAQREIWGWARVGGRNVRVPRRVTARYPARPFMVPALQASMAAIPELWRNIIGRAG